MFDIFYSFQNFSCICHLRNYFRRDKTTTIYSIETNFQQKTQMIYLVFCCNKVMNSLHRIARTINNLDFFVHFILIFQLERYRISYFYKKLLEKWTNNGAIN